MGSSSPTLGVSPGASKAHLRREERVDRLWSAGKRVGARVVAGAILFVAASLKAYQLVTERPAADGVLASRWVVLAVIEFELLLGLWLLSGVYPRMSAAVGLLCFSVFECISFGFLVVGRQSCGCFGAAHVGPWLSFVVDSVAITALSWACCQRTGADIRRDGPAQAGFRRVGLLLAVWLSIGVPLAAGAVIRGGSISEPTRQIGMDQRDRIDFARDFLDEGF